MSSEVHGYHQESATKQSGPKGQVTFGVQPGSRGRSRGNVAGPGDISMLTLDNAGGSDFTGVDQKGKQEEDVQNISSTEGINVRASNCLYYGK